MKILADADRIKELEDDNRRLRRLLDQRDAPSELRHRLRGTFALLSAVIRRSVQTPRDQASYADHLEDRLDAIARAQALADQYAEISLHTVLTDELLKYGGNESDRVALSGPELFFQPKAGQMLALAIHELTINSVEHGALGSSDGRVVVCWNVSDPEPEPLLTLCWHEPETRVDAQPARTGFGTEMLTRMLSYEFNANTTIAYSNGGLNCTMRIPMPARIGRVGLASSAVDVI